MPDSMAHLEDEAMRRLMAGEDHHPAAIAQERAMVDQGLVCDYCDRPHDNPDLQPTGMGMFMCTQCRHDIDHATRSGVFTFWELLDFTLLRAVNTANGEPVAAGLALSPMAGLTPIHGQAPWWSNFRFWYRERSRIPFDKLVAVLELIFPVRDPPRYFCSDCKKIHELPDRDWHAEDMLE